MKLTRPWTVYLIHHTHTDIGYTETQSRIEGYHLDFIDQLLEWHHSPLTKSNPPKNFRWTMECFWSVERWLHNRGSEDRERLAAAIRDGFVGLSGTYLHFNEMIDDTSVRDALGRGVAYGKSIGVPVDTALSADINGFSWGYAQALYDGGIRNLVTCVHPHHGLAPIGRRQLPFLWETPRGDAIWVWNGEHYMLGNVLGLVPDALLNYVISDELKPTAATPHNLFFAEQRLPRYLRQLEEDGYPFDFVPVHASGTVSDNAPPNPAIADFAQRWNNLHGDGIRVEMVTLAEFARTARAADFDPPRHRGDWPDWWSDGLASCPLETRLARKAQRGLHRLHQAKENLKVEIPADLEAEATQGVILYCEHTFNHSDSMLDPWNLEGKLIGARKKASATRALDCVTEAEEAVFLQLDGARRTAAVPRTYKVVNPFSKAHTALARIYLEYAEFDRRNLSALVRDQDGKPVPKVQQSPAPRGLLFEFPLHLEPGKSRVFTLDEGPMKGRHVERSFTDGASLVPQSDVVGAEGENPFGCRKDSDGWTIASPFAEVRIDRQKGIVEWSANGRSLLAPICSYSVLTPVYEHTPVPDPDNSQNQMEARGRMGRNRKGLNVERHIGAFKGLKVLHAGTVATTVRLAFELPGATAVHVDLRLEHWAPRATWTLRLNKNSLWDPENLFLSLPFDPGGEKPGQIWLDKAGAAVRPVEDQLPDTLTDWYCLQAGYAVCAGDFGIALATPDAPLLQLGSLEPGRRKLAGYPGLSRRGRDALSWLMTNYWETNFEASLGGFHEAVFHLSWGESLADPPLALEACRGLAEDFFTFRIRPPV